MADVVITPLHNEYKSNGGKNEHGIKTVLDKWEREINNLDKFGLPGPEFSRQSHAPYYGYPDVWDLSQVTDLTWIENGEVKSAIQAERISRQKRQSLPINEEIKLTQDCVKYCLNAAKFKYSDIEAIALSTPWRVKKINDFDLFKTYNYTCCYSYL